MSEQPRLAPTLAACAALLLGLLAGVHWLTGGFEHWTFEERRRQQARAGLLQAAPLSISDSQGRRQRVFDSAGRPVYLVDFIYTRCLSVCQVLGSEYAQMQQALGEAGSPRVQLLSLSFDVARDRQDDLAAYARLHRADARRWRIAAPQDPDAATELLRRLGVVAIPDGLGGFVHNGAIHLLDHQGRLLQIFDYTDWPQALAAARQLAP